MRKVLSKKKAEWLPPLPVDVPDAYALADYGFENVTGTIAPKYMGRHENLRRSWVRLCSHLPEATRPDGPKFDILELSTAHGATLELLSALGHRAEGTDFAVPDTRLRPYRPLKGQDRRHFEKGHPHPKSDPVPGWPYQPIIESLGLKVTLFDAGQTPYPFGEKSFDYILCYQALDAYGPVSDWPRLIDEMCRIARRGIVIGFNPPGRLYGDAGGWEASRQGWEDLRTYDRNGFRNVLFEMEETRRAFHPTACKLVAE